MDIEGLEESKDIDAVYQSARAISNIRFYGRAFFILEQLVLAYLFSILCTRVVSR